MTTFDDVLTQYEPMIIAHIRKLNIYRDYEIFRQAGRVALWQAWTRFDEKKGNFTPYAYRSIRGAMLDELKKENRFEEHVTQTEDELLHAYGEEEDPSTDDWSDRLEEALETLTKAERELINWLFIEKMTQAECAERAGISVAGIKKRRERMLGKLREVLR